MAWGFSSVLTRHATLSCRQRTPCEALVAVNASSLSTTKGRFILRDLREPGTRKYGTAVTYNGKGELERSGFTWILSGNSSVRPPAIIVELHDSLKFQIVVASHDTHSVSYKKNVAQFRPELSNPLHPFCVGSSIAILEDDSETASEPSLKMVMDKQPDEESALQPWSPPHGRDLLSLQQTTLQHAPLAAIGCVSVQSWLAWLIKQS